jgi:hypothetical protein
MPTRISDSINFETFFFGLSCASAEQKNAFGIPPAFTGKFGKDFRLTDSLLVKMECGIKVRIIRCISTTGDWCNSTTGRFTRE